MPRRPFRWTKFAKGVRTAILASSTIATKRYMEKMRRDAAREQGWATSALAMTTVDDERQIDEIAKRMSDPMAWKAVGNGSGAHPFVNFVGEPDGCVCLASQVVPCNWCLNRGRLAMNLPTPKYRPLGTTVTPKETPS